jgi:molybdopterin synthase catalytic subunit
MDPVGIARGRLDPALVAALVEEPGTHGAVVTFLGNVRAENLGRRVLHLEYEAFEALALRALRLIVGEIAERWPSAKVAIWHRVGELVPGDTSLVLACASPHRTESFAACRYALERVKQIAPIWKREHFEGGEVWIEGATADPADEAAREQAYRRACV